MAARLQALAEFRGNAGIAALQLWHDAAGLQLRCELVMPIGYGVGRVNVRGVTGIGRKPGEAIGSCRRS